jgi:hypothetical protein
MNLVIHQSNPHTTFDGHNATYAVCFDALTAQRVAMVQVVQLGEGVTQYRTMDRRSMPPDFELNDAIELAMTDQQRRAQRPPKARQPEPIRPNHSISRNVHPMPLPPERGFRRPPDTAPPMRRLLCQKLADRSALKGVA